MAIPLDEIWQHRRAATRFRNFCTFESDAIVLGAGTKMLELARMVGAPRADAWARMAALLEAAGHAPPNEATRLHVQTALLDWWRGDRALAQLRLALLPLPTLRGVEEAYPLFLAEHLLDRGMAPDELLRALETSEPTARKYGASQPRLPRGVTGGGEWTRGTGSPSPLPDVPRATSSVGTQREGRAILSAGRPASESPAKPPDGTAHSLIQPVFLDTEQQEGDVQFTPFLPHKPDENGDPPPQGHQPILGPPSGVGVLPWLAPALAPAPSPSGGSGSSGTDDRPEPPECLPKDDVPHGASANAMMYEYLLAQLLNPGDPTFKRRLSDPPTPKSQAYYLYAPSYGKFYSMDDCKKTDAIFIYIPEMRKGDGAEFKNENYWIPTAPRSKSYERFVLQLERLNEAALAEGRGRQIYFCFGSERSYEAVKRYEDDKYNAIRYAYCPRPEIRQ